MNRAALKDDFQCFVFSTWYTTYILHTGCSLLRTRKLVHLRILSIRIYVKKKTPHNWKSASGTISKQYDFHLRSVSFVRVTQNKENTKRKNTEFVVARVTPPSSRPDLVVCTRSLECLKYAWNITYDSQLTRLSFKC